MSEKFELLVTEGPLNGRRFTVDSKGVRLGRSSSCEIVVPDPLLSRNHCLFEVRDGALWVTDLVSANGTTVNGAQLDAEPFKLSPGDQVRVGDTQLRVLVDDQAEALPAITKIDLGLGSSEPQLDGPEEKKTSSSARYILWGVAAASICAAIALFLVPPAAVPGEDVSAVKEGMSEGDDLLSFSFEKVEANKDSIYRYALLFDGKSLTVQIDDAKDGGAEKDRHVSKSMEVGESAQKRLSSILGASGLHRLAREYVGMPLLPNTLQSFSLHVVRSSRVLDISVENKEPPDEFRVAVEQLETFAKNEFGIWAIQYSVDKLVEMSVEARRAGDAKWEERDVQYGNIAAALKKYTEAKVFLDTVEPKPADYASLEERRREVEAELERRFTEQRFRADRAIKMEDWGTAMRELRVLCEMVPDPKDKRHRDAASQLRDIEVRK